MKKVIFTWLICMIGVMSAEAQLSLNKENRRGNKNHKSPSTKRLLKDPHWEESDYRPKTTKKEQREINKNTRELEARSYSKEKSPYYNKRNERESKAVKQRQDRVKGGKVSQKDRRANQIQKESAKKYHKTQKLRAQKVNQNKKYYGTRASRKGSNNNIVELLSPKPKFHN